MTGLGWIAVAQTAFNVAVVANVVITHRRLKRIEGFMHVVRHAIGVDHSPLLDTMCEVFGGKPLRKRVEELESIVSALQASSPSPE